MRFMLAVTLACVLGASCRLYTPSVADCSVACGEGGACPDGFACRGTYCRPASGPAEDCACRVAETRACGSDVGRCQPGTQACSASGAWGVGRVRGGRGPHGRDVRRGGQRL